MTSPALTTLCEALQLGEGVGETLAADDAIRLASWMLHATRPWPDAAADTMAALLAAHREQTVDTATWRALRHAALALGESDDRVVRELGLVAEAASWPVASSRAGLTEMMEAICNMRARRAPGLAGWTDAEEAETTAILARIAGGNGGAAPPREDIPALFRAARPDLERGFVLNLQATNHAFSSFRAEVAAWLAGASRGHRR